MNVLRNEVLHKRLYIILGRKSFSCHFAIRPHLKNIDKQK